MAVAVECGCTFRIRNASYNIECQHIIDPDIAATLMGEVRLCKISDSAKAVNDAFAMCKEEFGKCRKYEVKC